MWQADRAGAATGIEALVGDDAFPGALAAGVTALAAPVTNGYGLVADLVMNSTVGGLASVAGGGKFANGAVTGAFGYLFATSGQNAIGSSDASHASDTSDRLLGYADAEDSAESG